MKKCGVGHISETAGRRCHAQPTGAAKVAARASLAVRWSWMLRIQTPYPQTFRNEGSPGYPGVGASYAPV